MAHVLRVHSTKVWFFAGLILFLFWNAALLNTHHVVLAQGGPTPTPVVTAFPQTFNVPCSVDEFFTAISSANGTFGDDIINLAPGCTYDPDIGIDIAGYSGDSVMINGNGATFAVQSDTYNLYVYPSETLIINNLTIRGGVAGLINYGNASLNGVTVGWNDNDGVVNYGGQMSITDSLITNNGTVGVFNYTGTMSINGSRITGNGYIGNYAGVSNTDGTLTVTESSIVNNGEGINSYTVSGSVAVSRTTIAHSVAKGLFIYGQGTFGLNNSTISGNGRPSVFDGNTSRLAVTIHNSTITANNSGDQLGALELGNYIDLTLQNTVVGGNAVAAGGHEITLYPDAEPSPDPATSSIVYEGNNFVGSINPAFAVSGAPDRVRTGSSPLLLALADNGGFTATHKPSLGSPLLDAGACNASQDQRGLTRPIDLPGISNTTRAGFCDIGAVEVDLLAVNDSYTTVFETSLNVPAPGVLANDGATNVSLALMTPPVNGDVSLNADGGFNYRPGNGFLGADSFTYVFIRNGVESNTARVLINVVAPIATDDLYVVEAGQTLTVPAPGVLANDKNPSTLTANLVEDPLNGTVTLNADGSFTYIPNANFSGADRFLYSATRDQTFSNPARVVISVTGSGSSGDPIFYPAPSNLQVIGSLVAAPIDLTFRWDVTISHLSQDDVKNEYHNLRITDADGFVLYEEWLPTTQICAGSACEVDFDESMLSTGVFTNGFYRWRVQTWRDGTFSRESDERGFEVNVSTPTLIKGDIRVNTDSGRPVILLPDNPNAQWYQIFIGQITTDSLVPRHLAWYKKDGKLCSNNICRFYPSSNPITGNYELWVQTWGPAGFGIGDVQTEIGGWAGPIPFAMDFSPPQPPTPLTVTYASSGRPQFSWQREAASTWFQLWTFDNDDETTYYANYEWVSSLSAGCLESLTCTWTPDFALANNRTFQWYIQTWGPGGFASQGSPTDSYDRWVQGKPYAVVAAVPDAPQPITPTKVVTKPIGLTYTWAHQPIVSWYQFEIEQTDDLPDEVIPLSFNNWYANEDLGCRSVDQVCLLEEPALLLPDGAYRWRLRAWNPAVNALSENQWSDWVEFTVVRE